MKFSVVQKMTDGKTCVKRSNDKSRQIGHLWHQQICAPSDPKSAQYNVPEEYLGMQLARLLAPFVPDIGFEKGKRMGEGHGGYQRTDCDSPRKGA
jgi:hypothetical protein